MASMALIDHIRTIGVFKELHAVDVLHNSRVCGTFRVDDSQKAKCSHAARKFVHLVAERPG